MCPLLLLCLLVALIQDLGYYPFSSQTFGDLTHYVRAGDFVAALVGEACDVNEYAFGPLHAQHYQQVPPALRANLLGFSSNFPATAAAKYDGKRRARVELEIDQLKALAAN